MSDTFFAITQAICIYRREHGIDGPLFLGIDTHALSRPAEKSALQILAANSVDVMLAAKDNYTPTPVISHAILTYNRGRKTGLSDGIVVAPSHNPPECGGFKYNPPHGGPAEKNITDWIESKANQFLAANLDGIRPLTFGMALSSPTTHRHDYLTVRLKTSTTSSIWRRFEALESVWESSPLVAPASTTGNRLPNVTA